MLKSGCETVNATYGVTGNKSCLYRIIMILGPMGTGACSAMTFRNASTGGMSPPLAFRTHGSGLLGEPGKGTTRHIIENDWFVDDIFDISAIASICEIKFNSALSTYEARKRDYPCRSICNC